MAVDHMSRIDAFKQVGGELGISEVTVEATEAG
jgi:hypothetical protein